MLFRKERVLGSFVASRYVPCRNGEPVAGIMPWKEEGDRVFLPPYFNNRETRPRTYSISLRALKEDVTYNRD